MAFVLSTVKSVATAALCLLAYPLIVLIPHYKAYVFVVTTGRSGSRALAEIIGKAQNTFAVHEPYPIMNNPRGRAGRFRAISLFLQFYLVKFPLIRLSRLTGKQVYLETNHLFAKSFARYALRAFRQRVRLIYLERPIADTAKSIYEIGKIPGDPLGNKWYLDPRSGDNLLDFEELFKSVDDNNKEAYRDFYKCAWYWLEMKARGSQFESEVPILRLRTSELGDQTAVARRFFEFVGVESVPIVAGSINRNLKRDEKCRSISAAEAECKAGKILSALGSFRDDSAKHVRFSVVVPLHNKAEHIQQTLKSVLDQEHRNFEILVIDDGSTDNSLDHVRSVVDSRVRIYTQDNRGVSVTRNRGIDLAESNWVCLLDADDTWKPCYLSQLARHISRDDGFMVYAARGERVSSSGVKTEMHLRFVPKRYGEIGNYFMSCFFGDQPLTASGVCLNKRLLQQEGLIPLFPAGVKRGEDLDAWARVAARGRVFFINSTLYSINLVVNSASRRSYRYSDSFRYERWFSYATDTGAKRMFLWLLVFKRKMHSLKKIVWQNLLFAVRQ